MKSASLVCLVVLTFPAAVLFAQNSHPFLSNLSATKDSPLYTTYAAALERSGFILDEGYSFLFDDSTRGPDFITDMAGDIAIAFKRGSRFVYTTTDLSRPPVITASYGDLVQFTEYPFDDLQVDATFLVESSRAALYEIRFTNVGNKALTCVCFPFLRNRYRTFDRVVFSKEANSTTFLHEEFPDDWVLEHALPRIDTVRDVVYVRGDVERAMSYRTFSSEPVTLPQVKELGRRQLYPVRGRAVSVVDEGHRSPLSGGFRIQVFLNGDSRRFLTENAPRWGSGEENVDGSGDFAVELGNFGKVTAQDSFTVRCAREGSPLMGIAGGTVHDLKELHQTRLDLSFGSSPWPREPVGLTRQIRQGGAEIHLSWDKNPDARRFAVYRRNYRSQGYFECIADYLRTSTFTDRIDTTSNIYAYVVVALDSLGRMSMNSKEVNNLPGGSFSGAIMSPRRPTKNATDLARVIAFQRTVNLQPGESSSIRLVRVVGSAAESPDSLLALAHSVSAIEPATHRASDEELYSSVPSLREEDHEKQLLYWSAFTLMRQVMLPPEGKCHYAYYVFSREPQWGWGHGGQVFHESLSMLAYALFDPAGAMNSQRVYMERQRADGYINYRTGPYLDEDIPYAGQLTTSAPWFAWENWEIFLISHDRKFLEDAYTSSVRFYNYVVRNRDADGDGLCEWGADAVLESVRDASVAVWDQVGWPSNFEAVDLNSMLVSEARALAAMAKELGRKADVELWESDAAERAREINEHMWDDQSGFYYNIDREKHSFSFRNPDDLKRREIIGFLPLWAGIADKEQAARLVAHLTDTAEFWRRYGIPSLAANDPFYDPKGYWNGPVWVEWNYLIVRGLLRYGYDQVARELTDRVARAMIIQLKKNHSLWEFYSPDDPWAGYHREYIWAGIIARMMVDVQNPDRR